MIAREMNAMIWIMSALICGEFSWSPWICMDCDSDCECLSESLSESLSECLSPCRSFFPSFPLYPFMHACSWVCVLAFLCGFPPHRHFLSVSTSLLNLSICVMLYLDLSIHLSFRFPFCVSSVCLSSVRDCRSEN